MLNYAKPLVVANSGVKCIPIVTSTHPSHVHDFYKKLVVSTLTLVEVNNLKGTNRCIRIALDKLLGYCTVLSRHEDDWQDWGFSELVETLRKETKRNPKIKFPLRKRKNEHKTHVCVYCAKKGH